MQERVPDFFFIKKGLDVTSSGIEKKINIIRPIGCKIKNVCWTKCNFKLKNRIGDQRDGKRDITTISPKVYM